MFDLVSYGCLGWFLWLMKARFDHYGKVCSGDFLADSSSNSFPHLQSSADMFKLYIGSVWIAVGALFVLILLYSCCVDNRPDRYKRAASTDTEDEDKAK